jgi:hypothetical protein
MTMEPSEGGDSFNLASLASKKIALRSIGAEAGLTAFRAFFLTLYRRQNVHEAFGTKCISIKGRAMVVQPKTRNSRILRELNPVNSRSRAKQLHLAFYQAVRTTPSLVSNDKVSPATVGEHPDSVHVSIIHKKLEHHGNIIRSGDREVVVFFADQLLPLIAKEFAETLGHIDVPSVRVHDYHVLGLYVRVRPRPLSP